MVRTQELSPLESRPVNFVKTIELFPRCRENNSINKTRFDIAVEVVLSVFERNL